MGMLISGIDFVTGGSFTRLVATAGAGLVLGAYLGWQVQGWRHSANDAAHTKAEAIEQIRATKDIREKEFKASTNNMKVNDDYQKAKAARIAATAARADAQRMLDAALALAGTRESATAGAGADDPRGAIAGECASALSALDEHAGRLAAKVTALQAYAGGVCLTPQ